MDARYADLETELCRIPEVTAARIVVDAEGQPTEVHILALPDKHAKQVVRDIQSVAMATFGLDLDRRLISVVQLEERMATRTRATGTAPSETRLVDDTTEIQANGAAPITSFRTDPGRPRRTEAPDGIRVIVDGVVTVRTGMTCAADVALEHGGDQVHGRAEGTFASSAVLRLVAQATLDALRQLLPTTLMADVETTTIVRLGERAVALVTIVLLQPTYEEVVAGAAVVRAAGEQDAVARAVLHAVNRRVSQVP